MADHSKFGPAISVEDGAPSSKFGAAVPSFPQGNQPATLPDVNNEDLKRWGTSALKLAPLAGATAATAFAPELSLPAMAGIAALGGAGGEGVRQATLAATGGEDAPRSFGQAAGRSLESGVEQGVGDLGGRLIARPLSWALGKISPTRLYGGALHPTTTLEPAARDALIQTGLSERIPVSQDGLAKLRITKEGINKQIGGEIAGKSGKPGMDINPLDVTKPVNQTLRTFGTQVNPDSDIGAIKGAKREFLDKHSAPLIGPLQPQVTQSGGTRITNYSPARPMVKQPISLLDAQAEKQGTYRMLEGKYDELGSAATEAQKSLARGLKDQIAARVPSVAPLNAREGKLIDLQGPMERSINAEAHRPTASMFHLPVVNHPEIKSNLAIGMNRIASSPLGRVGPVLDPAHSVPFAGRAMANGLGTDFGQPRDEFGRLIEPRPRPIHLP